MDKVELQNSIKALKQQRKRYEEQLKTWGIHLNDFPEDLMKSLKDCADLQLQTGLNDLQKNYLRQWQFELEQQNIEHKLRVAKLNADIKKSKQEQVALAKEINMLNDCLNAGQTVVTEEQFERLKSGIVAQITEFERKKESISIPADIDIDSLMKQVEFLEQRKEKEAKSAKK